MWRALRLILIPQKAPDEHRAGTEAPQRALSAAHTPPKPTGRGTWLFVLACFLICRSVWENQLRDPPAERIPNLSPGARA